MGVKTTRVSALISAVDPDMKIETAESGMVPLARIVGTADVKINAMYLKMLLVKVQALLCKTVTASRNFNEHLIVHMEGNRDFKLYYNGKIPSEFKLYLAGAVTLAPTSGHHVLGDINGIPTYL